MREIQLLYELLYDLEIVGTDLHWSEGGRSDSSAVTPFTVSYNMEKTRVPNTFSDKYPPKYKPINAFDYLVGRLNDTI